MLPNNSSAVTPKLSNKMPKASLVGAKTVPLKFGLFNRFLNPAASIAATRVDSASASLAVWYTVFAEHVVAAEMNNSANNATMRLLLLVGNPVL